MESGREIEIKIEIKRERNEGVGVGESGGREEEWQRGRSKGVMGEGREG